jgi:hypothetical protein
LRSSAIDHSFFDLSGIRMSAGGPGRAYDAYPSLHNVRWLFPADVPTIRQAGIDALFTPGSLRGRVLKKAIRVGGIKGSRVYLEDETLRRLEYGLASLLGRTDTHLAFFLGRPGAYRKVTAQLLSVTGTTLGYARIGTSQLAQGAIDNEHRNLLRLSTSELLRDSVPRVLGWLDWQGGKVLFMTGGDGPPGPERLSEVHAHFCEKLFVSFREEAVFNEGHMWSRMTNGLLQPDLNLPASILEDHKQALDLLDAKLGSVRIPLSLAHRDFVPWNTKRQPGGLFVFDWERGEEGVVPLYDMFHFQAMQASLLQRRLRISDDRVTKTSLRALWPEGQIYLPWLYLAYLLDMSLFYSEARAKAPHTGERGVWAWFVEQVGAFLQEARR